MSLIKSIALKPGTPLLLTSKRTNEVILDYTVPDEYQAVIHIVIDLFPKPSPLVPPKGPLQ